jgi:hypothetical protein
MKLSNAVTLALFCVAFALPAATAGAQENKQPCINDAITLCPQFIPNRERVANCLISNRSRISEACRMALSHYDEPTVSSAKLTTVP